jgi:hypothetical protein
MSKFNSKIRILVYYRVCSSMIEDIHIHEQDVGEAISASCELKVT